MINFNLFNKSKSKSLEEIENLEQKFIDPSLLETFKPSIDEQLARNNILEQITKEQTELKNNSEKEAYSPVQNTPEKNQPVVDKPTEEPTKNLFDLYSKHNSVYFFSISYTNTKFHINRIDTGYLIMPVDDSKLTFAHILQELDAAKKEFIQLINNDYPGLQIQLSEIKVLTLNLVINAR